MRIRRAAAPLLAACAAWAAPLSAQRVVSASSDPAATVPAELALALASGWLTFEFGTPEITVGALPAVFPSGLAPSAGERVIGGVTYSGGRLPIGRSAMALIASPAASDAASASFVSRLESAGWRRAPMPDLNRSGGFVGMVVDPSHLGSWCRDSLALTVTSRERAEGGSEFRLVLTQPADERRHSPCDPPRSSSDRRPPFEDLPLPALVPPKGTSRTLGAGSGGGSSERQSYTRLRTPLAPAQLLEHYAAQLREAGWTLGAPFVDGAVAVQAASVTDSMGRTLRGALMAIALPGGKEADISFRVVRPERDDG